MPGPLVTPTEKQPSQLFAEALAEIDRHLFLETQVPTYHNVVAQACLQTLLKWKLNGLLPAEYQSLRPYVLFSAPGNFIRVRMVAYYALIICGYGDADVWRYLLEVLRTDDSLLVRYQLLQQITAFLRVIKDQYENELEQRQKQELATKKQDTRNMRVEMEDLSTGE